MNYDSTPATPLQSLDVPPYSAGPLWREQSPPHTHTHTKIMGRKYSLWRREESANRAQRVCGQCQSVNKGLKSSVMWRCLCYWFVWRVWRRCLDTCLLLFFVPTRGWLIISNFLNRGFIGNRHVNVWLCSLNKLCIAINMRWMYVCEGAYFVITDRYIWFHW